MVLASRPCLDTCMMLYSGAARQEVLPHQDESHPQQQDSESPATKDEGGKDGLEPWAGTLTGVSIAADCSVCMNRPVQVRARPAGHFNLLLSGACMVHLLFFQPLVALELFSLTHAMLVLSAVQSLLGAIHCCRVQHCMHHTSVLQHRAMLGAGVKPNTCLNSAKTCMSHCRWWSFPVGMHACAGAAHGVLCGALSAARRLPVARGCSWVADVHFMVVTII